MAMSRLRRRHVVDHALAEADGAARRKLEAGEHAQGRRLAAARGPEQADELARLDVEVEIVDRDDRADTALRSLSSVMPVACIHAASSP